MRQNYYKAPHFDEYQFMARSSIVAVRYMGLDRWDSTNISFDDFRRMGKEEHKLFNQREIVAPSFALNVPEMKLLLARYFENRAGWCRRPKAGTPDERLKFALRKIEQDIPVNRATLIRLNEEYIALTRQGADPERLRKLENAIRSLDGEICMARRGLAPVVAIIYFYFRLGYNSPQVAAELGIQPMNVRQIAYRLQKLWQKMQSGQDYQPTKKEIANAQVREHRRNFTSEQRAAFKKYQREYKRRLKGTGLLPVPSETAREEVRV